MIKFSLSLLKSLTDADTFSKGYQLYKEKKVQHISVVLNKRRSSYSITGRVKGISLYIVVITVANEIKFSCSCDKYKETKACEHIVALGFNFLDLARKQKYLNHLLAEEFDENIDKLFSFFDLKENAPKLELIFPDDKNVQRLFLKVFFDKSDLSTFGFQQFLSLDFRYSALKPVLTPFRKLNNYLIFEIIDIEKFIDIYNKFFLKGYKKYNILNANLILSFKLEEDYNFSLKLILYNSNFRQEIDLSTVILDYMPALVYKHPTFYRLNSYFSFEILNTLLKLKRIQEKDFLLLLDRLYPYFKVNNTLIHFQNLTYLYNCDMKLKLKIYKLPKSNNYVIDKFYIYDSVEIPENYEKLFYLDKKELKLIKRNLNLEKNFIFPNKLYSKEEVLNFIYKIYLENKDIELENKTDINLCKDFLPKLIIKVNTHLDKLYLNLYLKYKNGISINLLNLIKLNTEFYFYDGLYYKIPKQLLEYIKTKLNIDNNKGFYIPVYLASLILYINNIYDNIELLSDEHFNNFFNLQEVKLPDLNTSIRIRQYQKIGFYWLYFLYKYRLSGVLADDMGLGKTFQTLLLLQKLKEEKKNILSLLIVPASLIYNWKYEIDKYNFNLRYLIYYGRKRKKFNINDLSKEYDLIITSYSTLRKDYIKFKDYKFLYIILDESQYIKNSKTQTFKIMQYLNSSLKLALTGTPIENSINDLISIFKFLNPDLINTIDINNMQTKDIKQTFSPFILRRTKSEVLKELPDKMEIDLYSSMTDSQKAIYIQLKDKFRNLVKENKDKQNNLHIFTYLLKLRQLAMHPYLLGYRVKSGKFEQFKNIVLEILKGDHKLIVFSYFTSMLSIMARWLKREKIEFLSITGKDKNKLQKVNYFNSKEELKVALISIKAGGIGLNITSADYVIIYDPWWNKAVENQAIDRVYRIGQKKNITVYRLISKETIEEGIIKLQKKKIKLIKDIISENEVFSMKDLIQLLNS